MVNTQNKYHPLDEGEYKELKTNLEGIGSHLPTHLLSYMWGLCNRIRRVVTPQPCGCASAGGLWKGCIDELREYITKNDE